MLLIGPFTDDSLAWPASCYHLYLYLVIRGKDIQNTKSDRPLPAIAARGGRQHRVEELATSISGRNLMSCSMVGAVCGLYLSTGWVELK